MALNGLFCADVPLRNYSLTHSLTHAGQERWLWRGRGLAASAAPVILTLKRPGYKKNWPIASVYSSTAAS